MQEEGKITILPEDVRNRIASDQVITNPRTILKELIENSIDASSSKIKIIIESNGTSKIKTLVISDNGSGIPDDVFKRLGDRWITSKDKRNGSLGYRGEAISFLVNSCDLEIKTSTSYIGKRVAFVNGIKQRPTIDKRQKGTTVIVSNLFRENKNRKKMMDFDTDYKEILKMVQRYSLVHDDIQFKIQKDGLETFKSGRRSDLGYTDFILEMLKIMHGKELAASDVSSIKCDLETIKTKFKIFFTKPNLKIYCKEVLVAVNGRLVQHDKLTQAVRVAYLICCKQIGEELNSYFAVVSVTTDEVETDTCSNKEKIALFNEDMMVGLLKRQLQISLTNLMNIKKFT